MAEAPLLPDKGRSATKVWIHPGRLVRFLILCLLVGLTLSFFGIGPMDFWRGAWSLVTGVYDMLVGSIGQVGSYILIGAAVIVPIWLLRLLWRQLGR